ncbi:MAG: YbaB/EbfC family nucleoid-associated protein [Rhodospirillaceae bacterium]|nr:YbaB/EbfC family nucleoid-associated protein [Rhodospirillaceae bacterium]
MKNIGQMMQKVQEMQTRMGEMQQKLADLEVAGAAGGGMVNVVVSGKGEMRSIKIDPSLINAAEKDMLEDLIVAAVNDAKAKADATAQAEMGKITGGLPLPPGFKMPF